jgi:hypothetical protein
MTPNRQGGAMDRTYFPKALSENLIVEELDGETLVYDVERNRAHCLNSTAGQVWKLCNGRRTLNEIARQLHRGTSKPDAERIKATEELVWLALDQLNRDHLLIKETFARSGVPSISRREAMRRVGIGAAIAIPIVASITAPTAVQAGSCKPSGANCGTGSQCCSGICSGNTCT